MEQQSAFKADFDVAHVLLVQYSKGQVLSLDLNVRRGNGEATQVRRRVANTGAAAEAKFKFCVHDRAEVVIRVCIVDGEGK
jgi:hypothetical protein